MQCIGARRLDQGHGHGLPVVQQRAQRIAALAQFDAADIADANRGAVCCAAHDDVGELLLRAQAALGADSKLKVGSAGRGRRADDTGRYLQVLLTHSVDQVAAGQTARSQSLGVEPDRYGVVARAERLRLADPGNAQQLVTDIQQHRVVVTPPPAFAVLQGSAMATLLKICLPNLKFPFTDLNSFFKRLI